MDEVLNILKNDNGMTLAELLIGVALLVFILASAYSLLQLGEVNWSHATQNMQAREEIARASSRIAADLRGSQELTAGAGFLELADNNEAVFYSGVDSDTAPEKIRYYQNGDQLVRSVTQPSNDAAPWVYANPAQEWAVAKYIRNSQGNPIFTYFDSSDNTITSLPASASDLAKIAQAKINLVGSVDTHSALSPITVQTSIFFRNRK